MATNSSSFESEGQDRFSLLWLEEGEYYFRDYNCHLRRAPDQTVAGHLKVCSSSVYFVPRPASEPSIRIPYRVVSNIQRVAFADTTGEDTFTITSSEFVDLGANDQIAPYKRHRGVTDFTFSLVYTSIDEVLPRIESLLTVARLDDSKEGVQQAARQLADLIQEHEDNELFNPGWLEDENEHIVLETVGSVITPLCRQPGRLVLTPSRLYFQPFNVVSDAPLQVFDLSKVLSMARRTYQLQNTGLEVFFPGRSSLYLTLKTHAAREDLRSCLQAQPGLRMRQQRSLHMWRRDWILGKVSNFDYLMYLNREAGRSFNDLTQYPVFPWIIADWQSKQLDLNNSRTFRDLTKPMGAINQRRLVQFQDRYAELKSMQDAAQYKMDGEPAEELEPLTFPPFLYGCHYSTPGYVVHYLMRSEPRLMLRLQNGRFDAPDRCFLSLADTWRSSTSLPTDVKELIPQFYSSDPSFLLNAQGTHFGTRSSGQQVGSVELPCWAADAQDFMKQMAQALESPIVCRTLHCWIDLVFGYRNHGPAAVAADNIFHHLTYDHIALKQLQKEEDPVLREALRVQMMEFGRTPRQLFTKPHPRRRVKATGAPYTRCCGLVRTMPAVEHDVNLQSSNAVRPAFQDALRVNAIGRAVARLTSIRPGIRLAHLAWLEQTCAQREPEHLALQHAHQLQPLVEAARSRQFADAPEVLARAVAALGKAPGNVPLILEGTDALEPLLQLLNGPSWDLAAHAAHAVAVLAQEASPQLGALPEQSVQVVLSMLQDGCSLPMRRTAVAAVAGLARSPFNRSCILRLGGLPMLVQMVSSNQGVSSVQPHLAQPHSRPAVSARVLKESPSSSIELQIARLRRDAANAVAVLLEDDACKQEMAQTGLEPLVETWQTGPAEVQTAVLHCLALLSQQSISLPALAAVGAVPLAAEAAHSRSPTRQQRAAVLLANLCAERQTLQLVAESPEALEALVRLSQLPDRTVQRNTARGLWHLAVAEGLRMLLLEAGGLAALLRLAHPDARSPEARTHARHALRRLADQPLVQQEMEECGFATSAMLGSTTDTQWGQLVAQLSGTSSGAGLEAADLLGYSQRSAMPPSPSAELGSEPSWQEPISRTGSRSPPPARRRHRRIHSAADSGGHAEEAEQPLRGHRSWLRFARSNHADAITPPGTPPGAADSRPSAASRDLLPGEGVQPRRPSGGITPLEDSPMELSASGSPFAWPAQQGQQLSSQDDRLLSAGLSREASAASPGPLVHDRSDAEMPRSLMLSSPQQSGASPAQHT